MNVLFWNANKKDDIDNCLEDLVLEKDCDIIVLAEYNNNINLLCNAVNLSSNRQYMPIPGFMGCRKIDGLVDTKYNVEVLREQDRYKIVMISTTMFTLLFSMIHNISLLRAGVDEQDEIVRNFVLDICEQEKFHRTQNTIIVDDFNINPFEKLCVAANVLHAVPYKEELQRHTRIIQKREYSKFYNPMWKFLSNREAPYGTYYYDNSGHIVNYYWNIFDQVVLRPQLINAFDDNSLCIVTQTTGHRLLIDGKPDVDKYSDHLPIFFSIKEEEIR